MIRLSPTTGLNLFRECPRCFWLHYNKNVHRPRGIFPSLPGGMDLVIKTYFDQYRGSLPPELEGKVDGVLMPDLQLMNEWRNWRTGIEYRDKTLDAVLFGALDDCLVTDGRSIQKSSSVGADKQHKAGQQQLLENSTHSEQVYIPLDYKTRGSAPYEGDSERYYQTQLDSYALLLSSNGYPVKDYAYLVYYYPEEVSTGGVVQFVVKPVKVETNLERAKDTFERAVKLLQSPVPKRHSGCEYCLWLEGRREFE